MEGSCPTESASPMEVRVDTEPWLLTEEVPPPPPVAVVAAEAAPILRLGVMETPETKKNTSFNQSNIRCIAAKKCGTMRLTVSWFLFRFVNLV